MLFNTSGSVISGSLSTDPAYINASLDAKLASGTLIGFGIVGDSTTDNGSYTNRQNLPGQGLIDASTWFPRMVYKLGCGYVRCHEGISGESLLDMRDDQLPLAIAKSPDIMVISVGLNSISGIGQGWGDSSTDRATVLGYIETMIDMCHASGIGVWLKEPSPRDGAATGANIIDDYGALSIHLPDIAKRKNVHRYIRSFTYPSIGGIDGAWADTSYRDSGGVHQTGDGHNAEADAYYDQIIAAGNVKPYPVGTMSDINLLAGPWAHTTAVTPTGWSAVGTVTWGTPTDDEHSNGTWAVTTSRTTSGDRIQDSFSLVPGNRYLLQGSFRGPDAGSARFVLASSGTNQWEISSIPCRGGSSWRGYQVNHIFTAEEGTTSGTMRLHFNGTSTQLEVANVGLYDLDAIGFPS